MYPDTECAASCPILRRTRASCAPVCSKPVCQKPDSNMQACAPTCRLCGHCRNLRVQILIKEGDSLESLSAKYDISESKLRNANGGQSEVTPGTELVIIQKVPSNLMPTPQNKLVPIEAAYSDDEGEMALVKENKQILDEQAQLAQFHGAQTPGEIRRDIIGTARYLGGILLIAGLGVWGVWGLWNFAQRLRHSSIRSRLEDPDIRAEMARRHGRSFLDYLDSENAEAEAEEIYDAKNSARRAAEWHLRRQHAALKLQQSAAASGAAAATSRSPDLEHAQQQKQQQEQQQQEHQQQEPVPALHKLQQQQEPAQALDQPSSQQTPWHSLVQTPSASQAAPEKSGASPHTAAADSKSGVSKPSDNLSHVLHSPSSSAVSGAQGFSAASSTETDGAASRPDTRKAASSTEADRAASSVEADKAASSTAADKAADSTEADKAVGQSRSSISSSLPPSMQPTAPHQSNGATVSFPVPAPHPSISDSEPESSVPASPSAASRSDSLAESPPDTASVSVDQEAEEAATCDDTAVHADNPAADDPAADVADDPVARQCPWVDSELLYFVTDDEGNPLNTILPAVGEAGVEQQQCFLAYEAHADMLAMMYKTTALLPAGLVPTGLHPLMLLDACMGEGRPLAIVREGAAGGTERVTDAQDWLQQLAASAQILFADEMKYILMSRLDKIEELEAEFAAEGASHDVAEAEADAEAAAAARVSQDPAPSRKRADSPKSHASDKSAGASTHGQQGATPSGEREDAYAAMKKKQVVHLSKDVLNQLNQSSTHAQASTAAPRPELKPQLSAVNSSSQNGNGRHAAPSHNGSAWQGLSHVCVPLIKNFEGDLGYVTADMAEGDVVEQHILAFQARSDAELVRYLVQAHLNELEAKVIVVPMTSEQLQTLAFEVECHVTVYPPGQLQLKPGMTFEQLRQAAVAAR